MTKRTGPSNPLTRALTVRLDKHGKSSQENAYRVISELLTVRTRGRAEVNLAHLNKMATAHPTKIFVVPGTVLGNGELTQTLHVAALRFTGSAQTKIAHAKGKAYTLNELMEQKIPASKLVLVK